MLGCIGEPEDADPEKIRSVSQGCGEFGINRLGCQQSVDARESGLGTSSLLPAPATSLARLTASQLPPQSLSIDEYPSLGDDISEEARLTFGVLESNHVDGTTGDRRELLAQIDNSLQTGVAQVGEYVDVAARPIGPRSDRTEENGKANVPLGPQDVAQSGK
jgi:hypothetical protein